MLQLAPRFEISTQLKNATDFSLLLSQIWWSQNRWFNSAQGEETQAEYGQFHRQINSARWPSNIL